MRQKLHYPDTSMRPRIPYPICIGYGYARDTPGIRIHRVSAYWAAMGLETQVWIRICCRIGEQREERASSRSAAAGGGGRREDGGAGHRSRAELAARRDRRGRRARRPPGRESQRGAPAAAAPNRGRRREQGRPYLCNLALYCWLPFGFSSRLQQLSGD